MEQKLNEKKAILEVIESLLDNMKWTVDSKNGAIETWANDWKTEQEIAKEEGREPNPDCDTYDRRQAERAEEFLKAYEIVKKHLEKLI